MQTSVLSRLGQSVKTEFERTKRILSFDEYLEVVESNPHRHTRGSAQYLADMMDYFGTTTTASEGRRFKVFDLAFDDPKYRVIDQCSVQNDIYQTLQTFVREGVNNKLILLHGPNGSAKSTIVGALTRGLEKYSHTDEGAKYRFNWVFPVDKVVKGNLGLASYSGTKPTITSYAKLTDDDIAARVSCELKDHPLLLLPKEARAEAFKTFFAKSDKAANLPEYLTKGDLCHKCKQIAETLLTAHKGDITKVLMHVQVERFYISKRYRTSAVTIEPQMHVDANSRQITMDRNIASLPSSLQGLSLYELSGDLVDGNRGVVEFADLLKRPVDTFKYLLVTCETSSVNVGNAIAYLDTVFIGSTNELQLDAFKEFPDFMSFKARIELIRVPYILEYSEEKKIYDIVVEKISAGKHITPHTTQVAALWAVLSRLKKPNAVHYPPALTNIVTALKPIEKARLYDHGEMPPTLSAEEKKLLKASLKKLREEYNSVPYYEGRMGASAREIKNILYDAAHNEEFACLSPIGVFKELDEFVKRTSEYEFLKQDIKDGYHDCIEFIHTARSEYLGVLDQEVRESMGVFEARQYEDFLKKYIHHLSHLLKKEKIKNPLTGRDEQPDQQLLEEFEHIVGAPAGGAEREAFRNNVISTIGAYALDHPGAAVDYKSVFPDFMRKLENHYFEQQKSKMRVLNDALTFWGTDKEDPTTEHYKLARRTIDAMVRTHGYCDHCARQSILFLLKAKY